MCVPGAGGHGEGGGTGVRNRKRSRAVGRPAGGKARDFCSECGRICFDKKGLKGLASLWLFRTTACHAQSNDNQGGVLVRKVILLFAVAWVCAVGAAQGNPSIATLDPDQSLYDASLRASVTSADDGTAVWFEWGSDTNYGQAGPVVEIGTQAVVVSNAISGLTPYTTYHCQAVASNSAGVFYGGDVAFTTVPRFAQR